MQESWHASEPIHLALHRGFRSILFLTVSWFLAGANRTDHTPAELYSQICFLARLRSFSEASSGACDPDLVSNFQPEVSVLGPLSCCYRESLAMLFPLGPVQVCVE